MNEPLLDPEPLVLSRSVSAYEQLVQRLSDMGFDQRLIELAISFTGATTVEEAIDYLLKGENGWTHSFIPMEEDESICMICKEEAHQHSEYSTPIRSPSIRLSRVSYRLIENPCQICYEEMVDSWSMCGSHMFCRNCIQEFLHIKISESQVASLHCPGDECPHTFTDEIIFDLVTSPVYQKYLKFKRRAEIMKDPTVRWCLTPNCEGYARGSQENPKIVCPECAAEMCFRCGEAWHSRTCEEAVDRAYESWARGKEVQLCPRCRHRIEKIEGCNHMSCIICDYQWCWLCRGAYTPMHFNPLNPFGCSNLQGGDNTRAQWPLYLSLIHI